MGRERELGLLHDAFERARAGHGQIVFVAGEPGIGKSRLLLEFRRRLGGEGTWVEGHCMSFGRSIAFHPLIDLLKRTFRIEEGDGEAAIARKIDRSVLGLGEDLRPTLPYLRYLLSVDPGDASLAAMDPQQRRGEIFDAVRRLTMRAAEVIRRCACSRTCTGWTGPPRTTSSPSPTASRAAGSCWCSPTGRASRTRSASGATTRGWRSTRCPARTAPTWRRACSPWTPCPRISSAWWSARPRGNPFFIEEVVKSLQEVGALRRADGRYVLARPLDEIMVPDSIQDVIMARIDRLEPAAWMRGRCSIP